MIAALWLVVAIAVVALQFSLDAKERRELGLNTAERGVGRAAALGAMALVQERIETALRDAAALNRGNVTALRASDPLLNVDSLYSGTLSVDSLTVDVRAEDLGSYININIGMAETEWRQFFNYVLKDDERADSLAQAIMDWRDIDDNAREKGGEHDDYVKAGLLALPANADFREPSDLLLVKGMTPDVYAMVSPYLTTRGTGIVDLNNAPVPVLWSLPGMNDAIVAQILQMRSGGQRITSVAEVVGRTQGRQRLTPAQAAAGNQAATRLAGRAGVNANEIQLTITARTAPQAEPVKLYAILQRAGTNMQVTWRVW